MKEFLVSGFWFLVLTAPELETRNQNEKRELFDGGQDNES
jgi:hypothetical protein